MSNIQLFHGDCVTILQKMTPESADLVVTSPPYNLGIEYSTYKDSAERTDFLTWCRSWAREIHQIMKPNASFFLNIGAAPSNPLLPYQLILELTQTNDAFAFHLQNTFHWIKSISIQTPENRTLSVGHFKPINSKRFVNDCHEFIFHLTKTNSVELDRKAVGVPYVYKSNIKRWGHTDGKDQRCRGNTWYIPYDTIQKRDKDRPHPATFPVELVKRCIRIHGGSDKVATMVDPFNGIGSSALAAHEEEIENYIGIDIDERYLEFTRSRLAQKLAGL